ncbi:MAG: homocysteine S-methyltransferase family protein [Clostridia bacterium]|nr:homocysteine S-methyltransferase family protein [Clostridia bacterium]
MNWNKRLYFDGGTGTVLQAMGLAAGETPESWNLSHPEKITALHTAYLDAGANIIKTNTFGINRDKYENYEELIAAAMGCAKAAAAGREEAYIAFDVGPTGRLLEPLGDLPFEEAVALFAANMKLAKKYGADLILIETMNDSYETKAAVLAAKEQTDLPVFVTNVYDGSGKLMTGADPAAMVALLEGMGVDAIGMNCSLGPAQMVRLVEQFAEYSSLPVIVNPNAGLPEVKGGKTVFTVGPEEFAGYMEQIARKGGCILGGCCGTTPDHIRAMRQRVEGVPYALPAPKNKTVISSYTHAVEIGPDPILIGERINPTGKPKLKEALRSGDLNYILNEGIRQADAGVQLLDVNVGLPEINEQEMMKKAVAALQAVTDLPLQLDSNNPAVLADAMRIYNGKPLINSVNGEQESMDAVFSLVQKYGGAVIALTMDKSGIPTTAEGRVAIAERIARRAAEFGIAKKELIVDPLALTVSSDQNAALVTLDSIRLLRERGFYTSLGVSNISFGLPAREKINSTFFACAMEKGLNCAIMNPFTPGMMDAWYAYRALHGLDTACTDYIGYADQAAPRQTAAPAAVTLHDAVVKGMKEAAMITAGEALQSREPLEVINGEIIPALNEIGEAFEQKKAYLPQLLMSAEAANAAFELVKEKLPPSAATGKSVILATVKGDIHDIGKNIVRVLLESYGFKVYDLGRDVAPEAVWQAVEQTGCRLVGLSALMTTTVPAMAETIALLHEKDPAVKVMVGGAVLTPDYAEMIHADFYGKDAMESVRIAEEYYRSVC